MTRLDNEVGALASLSPAQLRERWTRLEESPPPSVTPALLGRLLAQRMQERRFGALPTRIVRQLTKIASGEREPASIPAQVRLRPGTRLVREWNGNTIAVEVLEKGFAFGDRTWNSLSEIARHVTGAHWSGPRFFGLTGNG